MLADKTNAFIGDTHYKTDDFQNKYKQALFEILRRYYVAFKNNNYTLPAMPEMCKLKSNEYLAYSDDIYDWFSTIYEKIGANEIVEPIKISDIYEHFTSSSVYTNMSKIDKRKYTLKYFNEKVRTNIFLQNYYRPKHTYINKIRYFVPILLNFKEIKFSDE